MPLALSQQFQAHQFTKWLIDEEIQVENFIRFVIGIIGDNLCSCRHKNSYIGCDIIIRFDDEYSKYRLCQYVYLSDLYKKLCAEYRYTDDNPEINELQNYIELCETRAWDIYEDYRPYYRMYLYGKGNELKNITQSVIDNEERIERIESTVAKLTKKVNLLQKKEIIEYDIEKRHAKNLHSLLNY